MSKNKYFVVSTSVLPEIFLKVVEANKYLDEHPKANVSEAINYVGISRSAYYKYCNHIFTFTDLEHGKRITLLVATHNKVGVLAKVISTISKFNGNMLTINQELPMNGRSLTTMTIDTQALTGTFDEMIEKIKRLKDVISIDLIAME